MALGKNKRFGARCYWCATEVFPASVVGIAHPKLRTVDHIRSKPECVSAAEYRHYSNMVTACYACNQRRSTEWCRRRDAGLVHATEWSLKEADRLRAWEEKKKLRKTIEKERREYHANCKPCRVVHVEVPCELEEALRSVAL